MTATLSQGLLDRNLVNAEQIEAVKDSPLLTGWSLAVRMYESALVTADDIYVTLLDLGARDANADLRDRIQKRLLALVPSRIAHSSAAIPFRRHGKHLMVAMLDPSDAGAVEELALFTGFAVEPYVAHADLIFALQEELYGIAPPAVRTTPIETASHVDMAAGPAPQPDVAPMPTAGGELSCGRWASLQATATPGWAQGIGLSGTPAGWLSGPDQTEIVHGWFVPSQDAQLALLGHACVARLITRFTRCALFLVREAVAVGWDAAGPNLDTTRLRHTLLPLTPQSTLKQALTRKRPVLGEPDEVSATDRILFNFFGPPAPRWWMVAPVVIRNRVRVLIYVDASGHPPGTEDQHLVMEVARHLTSAMIPPYPGETSAAAPHASELHEAIEL